MKFTAEIEFDLIENGTAEDNGSLTFRWGTKAYEDDAAYAFLVETNITREALEDAAVSNPDRDVREVVWEMIATRRVPSDLVYFAEQGTRLDKKVTELEAKIEAMDNESFERAISSGVLQ